MFPKSQITQTPVTKEKHIITPLQVFCFNASGVTTKIKKQHKPILGSNYDILIFLENWLTEKFSDAELAVKSFISVW